MKKKSRFLIIGLIFSSGFLFSLSTVETVVDKYIQAMGGYKKLNSIQSKKLIYKISIQGREGKAEIYYQRPGYYRVDAFTKDLQIIQAYDGKTSWRAIPSSENPDPQELPPKQAKDLIEDADMDGPLVDYKKKGHSLELLGMEQIESKEFYKLKLTSNAGNIRFIYINSDSFLISKVTSKIKQGGNDIIVDTLIGDYRNIAGIMVPHYMEIKVADRSIRKQFLKKVEFNIEMDKKMFQMPVKEQTKKQIEK